MTEFPWDTPDVSEETEEPGSQLLCPVCRVVVSFRRTRTGERNCVHCGARLRVKEGEIEVLQGPACAHCNTRIDDAPVSTMPLFRSKPGDLICRNCANRALLQNRDRIDRFQREVDHLLDQLVPDGDEEQRAAYLSLLLLRRDE